MLTPTCMVDGIHMSAADASERIAEIVKTDPPASVRYRIRFDSCGHPHEDHQICGVCYAATVSALLFQWSHARLQTEGRSRWEANRLSAAIKALIKEHGPVTLGVIGLDQVDT